VQTDCWTPPLDRFGPGSSLLPESDRTSPSCLPTYLGGQVGRRGIETLPSYTQDARESWRVRPGDVGWLVWRLVTFALGTREPFRNTSLTARLGGYHQSTDLKCALRSRLRALAVIHTGWVGDVYRNGQRLAGTMERPRGKVRDGKDQTFVDGRE